MTPENFIYWLNGFFEINDATGNTNILEEAQVKIIKDHLKLVLTKVTPEVNYKKDTPSLTDQVSELMKKDHYQGFDYSPTIPVLPSGPMILRC